MEIDVACQLSIIGPSLEESTLAAVLPRLAAAGYRRVVLPRFDPDAVDLGRIARQLADHDIVPIGMAGLAPGHDVGSADPAERARGLDALRTTLAVTEKLGGDQLNGVPYGPFGPTDEAPDEATMQRAATAVGAIADEAHERGIAMTFEVLNRYETARINTAAQALAFVEASGSDHLGIHLDTYHMTIEEPGVIEAITAALPRLGYLELGQSGRGLLSVGAIDIEGIVASALDAGYEGRWGIEAFSRATLPAVAANRLAIWRRPYDDGVALAEDAARVIRTAWTHSETGRRVTRERRAKTRVS